MSATFQYPNSKYVVSLTGTERTNYLTKVKDLYNNLKSKGYPMPSATIEGTNDSTYVKCESKSGDFISKLFKEGKLSQEKARKLSPRVMEIVDEIKSKEGITIYNTHTGNVVYDPSSDKLYLMDITQNSNITEFRTVKKLSQEYLDKLAKQQQLQEDIEKLESEIKELEKQKEEAEEDDEVQFTSEDQTTLDNKRKTLEDKKAELDSLSL